ncbi:hypothetical protein J2T38_000304 [Neisseria perflava]|uniref:hypothetical protein n=1 Tax=Neisseria perflava TaxID=33053 RepID=UPI00209EA161|nr:hypothetical protein [Neisseria perflava]MCP1771507.1 hypothetical protein [Neisseria perflava]
MSGKMANHTYWWEVIPYAVPAVTGGLLLLMMIVMDEAWARQYEPWPSLVFGCAIGSGMPWLNKISKGWLAGEHRFRWYEWLMFLAALAFVGVGVQIIVRPQILGEVMDKPALLVFIATSWLCNLCLTAQDGVKSKAKMEALTARVSELERKLQTTERREPL